MAETQWYELRVLGSAGTRAGAAIGVTEGIALSDSGRLCAISSGQAKRFHSEQDAIDFLAKTTVPGLYPFEPVVCRSAPQADAGRRHRPVDCAA